MKKLVTFSFLMLISLSALAQYPYTLSMTTGTYTELSDNYIGKTWFSDWPSMISIGFPFTVLGKTYDEFEIEPDGEFKFYDPHLQRRVRGFVVSKRDRGGFDTLISPITYRLDGNPPNRIFKMQWENAGFVWNSDRTDYINYQMWLYEGTNIIEIHVGENSVQQSSYHIRLGPIIGVHDDVLKEGYYIAGNPANPVIEKYTIDTAFIPYLTGTPSNGTIYKLTPVKSTSTRNMGKDEVSLFPNPANESLSLNGIQEPTQIKIFNLKGKEVLNEIITPENNSINIETLDKGIFLVKLEKDGVILTKKLIIN